MTKEEDKVRVGSTPNLKYVLKDPRGNEVSVVSATILEMRFLAPSGGTSKTLTPALFSGTVAEIHMQTLGSTFDAEGAWEVIARATFAGSRVFESTVDTIHVDASKFP